MPKNRLFRGGPECYKVVGTDAALAIVQLGDQCTGPLVRFVSVIDDDGTAAGTIHFSKMDHY